MFFLDYFCVEIKKYEYDKRTAHIKKKKSQSGYGVRFANDTSMLHGLTWDYISFPIK